MAPPPPLPPAAGDAADESLPAVARSVEELASFSDRLTDFLGQWHDILVHANSIAAALPPLADPDQDRKPSPSTAGVAEPRGQSSSVLVEALAAVTDRAAESNPNPDPATQLKPDGVPVDAAAAAAASFPVPDPAPEPEPEPVLSAVVEPNPVPEPDPAPKPKAKPAAERERRAGEPSEAALGAICEQMGSRSLRRFATAHLRDRSWLRRVGPAALRRAPDPAALVLRAVSRYYICAESESAEAACVLLLELYVRAGCPSRRRRPEPEGEAELRAEARVAALSWRSRIVREKGRVADASARDGRGLILLMAAFGVPPEFPGQELYDLLLAGGCLACADVLKCSQLFVKKLRDVVVHMVNKGSYCEAIGVILSFELQDAFPLGDVLSYILDKVEDDRKFEGQSNLAGSKEYDEEELVLWRSISKCVEEHSPCSSEISCFGIAERIKVLEERVGKQSQPSV
ncbi:protein FRIGIDA [Lolium perenne]|uniref:protein FRIGIDA n=1 Tax=Lolium perenne TaxID=4522 RepID=UPI0021F50FF7|nr:inactive protein FRIGIDA [Lolium perenne]